MQYCHNIIMERRSESIQAQFDDLMYGLLKPSIRNVDAIQDEERN